MSFMNEGGWDRGVRLLAAVLLLYAGSTMAGTLGFLLLVVGGVALVTGIAGSCPAYILFGVSTRKSGVAHCPSCEPHGRV